MDLASRFSAADRAEIDALARELIGIEPEVIVTLGTPATAAVTSPTHTIPVVFATVTDPSGDGFVSDLARPDGDVTGFTNFGEGMGGKWFDLMKQVAPSVKRIGVMFNPDAAPGHGMLYFMDIESAALGSGTEIIPLRVRNDEQIRAAIAFNRTRSSTSSDRREA